MFITIFCGCSEETPGSATLSETTFIKTYEGIYLDSGMKVLESSDNFYYIAGSRISDSGNDTDVFLIKTDKMGNLIYEKTIGYVCDEHGYAMVEMQDGNLLIAGEIDRDGSFGDAYVVKVNPEGDALGEYSYGEDRLDYVNSIVELNNGDIILAGDSKSFHEYRRLVYLLKIDYSGSEYWSKTFSGLDEFVNENLYTIDACLTNDGNVAILGEIKNGPFPVKTFVLKVDPDGNQLWLWISDFCDNDVNAKCMTPSIDGGVIIAGEMNPSWSQSFPFITKLDEAGNQELLYSYESYSKHNFNDILLTPDNELLVTGHRYSGRNYLMVFKTDHEGNPILDQSYGKGGCREGRSISLTHDNYILITGKAIGVGASNYNNMCFIKTDINGWVGGDLP